ncbi:hypothetical protein Acr_00g0005630 [Actinidia rufa]|uniref:Reverse transcriptase domain-containing protein n=1 Tax=Actinidia rufa TaxID=165716 RepID=A0A7J0D9L6_9ERIC|nr:hypothetical protein Acr_00g0005630 [Actinidia rufa]
MKDNILLLQELLRYVRWIMTCISTISYSLSYNGSLHGFFEGKRGLRPGDPLSLYLFVHCLEYLCRGLGELKNNMDFNFHPKCRGLNITHLAFADDLVLFSRGDITSVSLLMQSKSLWRLFWAENRFCQIKHFTVGIYSQDKEAIKGITGFSQGSFPFRYLGIPIADSRIFIAQISLLIDKISGYISAWVSADLSYAD